jgi:glycosyltransferase involved in cell wall biosynthesis
MNATGQTICLNMIVKNEAAVIRRCLDSVLPIIDHWVIVDTGSTDGTQNIIRAHLSNLPGELHERPWRDFAYNRSEALELARGKSDYTFVIDADDTLEIAAGTTMPALTADSYTIEIGDTATVYRRTQVVRSAMPWRYEGVLHEYLTCDGADWAEHLSAIRMRRNHDGARRKDPFTYLRDATVLESALQTETSPFLRARYRFYLAQSYRDCGKPQNAVEHYLARAELGFWQEEVFISLYCAAQLMEQLGHPDQDVVDAYLRATDALPTRAEALHGASQFCRNKGRNEEGYQLAKRGLEIPMPPNALFVEPWIYETGLLDEFAVNAYWSGRYRDCLDASLKILAAGNLSGADMQRVVANARFASEKLPQQVTPNSLDVMIRSAGSFSPGVPLAMPAVATARSMSGMVSVITPTRNRDRFLKNALTYFRDQDYTNIEWLILDDGLQASEYLDDLTDENIFYQHMDRKISIGEKRNTLIEKAKGEIIIHFDDDDYYAPNYVSSMVSALTERGADLINLRGWFLYDVRSDFFGYWDLMQKEGPHYRCDREGVALTMLSPENNLGFENNELGYGFSYVFKRQVWKTVKFPTIDWNEDGEFSLQARSKFKVDGIHDTQGICLHFLHLDSTSCCFPQNHLQQFMFQKLFPDLDFAAGHFMPPTLASSASWRSNGSYAAAWPQYVAE